MANPKGSPTFSEVRNKDTGPANKARAKKADDFAMKIGRIVHSYDVRGCSMSGMAKLLNADGILTSRGKRWSATALKRVINRLRGQQQT